MKNRVVIDIGNTRISTGVFVEGKLVDLAHHLLSNTQSAADYVMQKADAVAAQQIALCSVAPSIARLIVEILQSQNRPLLQVSEESQTLISDTYSSLGADRIANMAGAWKLYAQTGPVIVMDFGSATTLSAVSQEGKFLGGLITLGLTNTFHSLHENTEQLPDLSPYVNARPINPLAFDTPGAIASGCILAHVGLIEHWIKVAKDQLGENATVIATGGCATTLAPLTQALDRVDPDLTIYGINFIAEAAEGPKDRC